MNVACRVSLLLVFACNALDARAEPLPQPAPQLSGSRRLAMRNCPSAVPTARTIAQPTPDGVDLVITSTDVAARKRIIALAQMHATFGVAPWGMPPHSGMHSGPATIGFCPIVHTDTIVTSAATADGARIHVRARTTTVVRHVQRETQARIDALQRPST